MAIFNIANGDTGLSARTKLNNKLGSTVDAKADFGAIGDGVTDDTLALQLWLNGAFAPTSTPQIGSPTAPNGQGNPKLNRRAYLPPGNYVITSPLYLRNVAGAYIHGAGNGTSQIIYQGTGAEGNTLSSTSATVSPIFMVDGMVNSTFENIAFSGSPSVAQPTVTLTTNATTAAGAGSRTLHFASVPATIKANMFVFDSTVRTVPTVVTGTVVSTTATTVVLSADVDGVGVGSGDTIYFASGITGIYIFQSGSNNSTSAITFRNLNFNSFGFCGIFCDGTANCEDCSLYDCQFNFCAYAGLRLFGQNTLNWGVHGGGSAVSGVLSTFKSAVTTGNGSAAFSVQGGGITAMNNVSISGGTDCVDIFQNGSQPIAVIGGRSESLTSIINNTTMVLQGWNWGPTTSTGCTAIDLSFGGAIRLEGCTIGANVTPSGTPALLCLMGNGGVLDINNTFFQNSSNLLGISGGGGSKFYLRGAYDGGGFPTAATLFGSYTGMIMEYEPIKNTVVGSLPTAATKYAGLRGFVTDATATTFATTVAGSGANKVPVYCDGTAWKIG